MDHNVIEIEKVGNTIITTSDSNNLMLSLPESGSSSIPLNIKSRYKGYIIILAKDWNIVPSFFFDVTHRSPITKTKGEKTIEWSVKMQKEQLPLQTETRWVKVIYLENKSKSEQEVKLHFLNLA